MRLSEQKIKSIINLENMKIYLSYLRINKLNGKKYESEIEIHKDGVSYIYIIISHKYDIQFYKRVKLNISYVEKALYNQYIKLMKDKKDKVIILRKSLTYSEIINIIIKSKLTDDEFLSLITELDKDIPIINKLYNFVMDRTLYEEYSTEKVTSKLFFDKLIGFDGKDITKQFYIMCQTCKDYIDDFGLKMNISFFSHRTIIQQNEKGNNSVFHNRNKVFTNFITDYKNYNYEVKNIQSQALQYNVLSFTIKDKYELREAFRMINYLFSDIILIRRDMVLNNVKCTLNIRKHEIILFKYETLFLNKMIDKCNMMVADDDTFFIVDTSI